MLENCVDLTDPDLYDAPACETDKGPDPERQLRMDIDDLGSNEPPSTKSPKIDYVV